MKSGGSETEPEGVRCCCADTVIQGSAGCLATSLWSSSRKKKGSEDSLARREPVGRVMPLVKTNHTPANRWRPPAPGRGCASHARVPQRAVKVPLSLSRGEGAKHGHVVPEVFAAESVANWELNIEILLSAA